MPCLPHPAAARTPWPLGAESPLAPAVHGIAPHPSAVPSGLLSLPGSWVSAFLSFFSFLFFFWQVAAALNLCGRDAAAAASPRPRSGGRLGCQRVPPTPWEGSEGAITDNKGFGPIFRSEQRGWGTPTSPQGLPATPWEACRGAAPSHQRGRCGSGQILRGQSAAGGLRETPAS